jgi:hypothetical protein
MTSNSSISSSSISSSSSSSSSKSTAPAAAANSSKSSKAKQVQAVKHVDKSVLPAEVTAFLARMQSLMTEGLMTYGLEMDIKVTRLCV